MKTVLAFALALLITPSAFAAKHKLASVNELEADAKAFSQAIGEGTDCSLSVDRVPGGIRIIMESRSQGSAWLIVKYTDAVHLTAESEREDSYMKEYQIDGRGTLTAVQADDAYFHLYLESNGQQVGCELDF
jgi:hypothetical protein